jgi:hypothetical protein
MKYLQSFILILSATVIFFGFYQLKYENDIFVRIEPNCCNSGLCNYYQGKPALCSETSQSYLTLDGCGTEYLFTCKHCVEYTEQGLVCWRNTNSCMDQLGNCYGWCLVNGKWQWNLTQK